MTHVQRRYLEVVVLPLLLGLEPQPRQPAQVLLAHRFVHRRAAPDALAVVVRDVRPPVRLSSHKNAVQSTGGDTHTHAM